MNLTCSSPAILLPQGAHLLITVSKTSTDQSLPIRSNQKCSEYQLNLKFNSHKTRLTFPASKQGSVVPTSALEDILESLIIPSSRLPSPLQSPGLSAPLGCKHNYRPKLWSLRPGQWPQAAAQLPSLPADNFKVQTFMRSNFHYS